MNLLWDLYWPMITGAVVIGVIIGAIAFRKGNAVQARRHRQVWTLVGGAFAVVLIALAWHGPVKTGERFANTVERQTRQVLVDFEMEHVRAVLRRDPLRRSLVLSGPADDFQRSELVRILNEVPGVAEVHWRDSPAGFTIPLAAEAELAALVGFGLGLLLAYLLELRRRFNAQWSW